MVRAYTLSMTAALCWIAAALTVGAPQEPKNSQLPKFQSQTELVLVPVIAHRGGKHVEGLKSDDFTLLMGGKPQAIDLFEEVHPSPPVKTVQTGEFSNMAGDSGGAARQFTIVAIDFENTAPLDQTYLKEEIVKFLSSVSQTNQPFGLIAITRSGIRVLHDFTSDTSLLAAAVKGQPSQNAVKEAGGGTVMDFTPCARSAAGCGGGSNADEGLKQLGVWINLMTTQEKYEIFRDRTTHIDTLAALQQLAQSLRGLPGRKTLVWASSGTQIFGGMSRMFNGTPDPRGGASTNLGAVTEALDQNAYTFNLLNLANVAVYPLDARHGANTSFANYDVINSDAPLDEAVAVNRADNKEIIESFKAIAAATGGKPCFNRTDLANCLQEAADDSQNYYMLGFYLDKGIRPGWYPITVKLNGLKTDLNYRDGVLVNVTSPEKSKLSDLQLAVLSPLNYTALPFHGRFDDPVDKGDKKVIKFALEVPPGAINPDEEDNHLGFDVVVAVRGKGGKEIKKMAQRIDRVLTAEQAAVIRTRGIHYTNLLELPPGDYGVWLVMRESSSGRTGSAVTTLNIK